MAQTNGTGCKLLDPRAWVGAEIKAQRDANDMHVISQAYEILAVGGAIVLIPRREGDSAGVVAVVSSSPVMRRRQRRAA